MNPAYRAARERNEEIDAEVARGARRTQRKNFFVSVSFKACRAVPPNAAAAEQERKQRQILNHEGHE